MTKRYEETRLDVLDVLEARVRVAKRKGRGLSISITVAERAIAEIRKLREQNARMFALTLTRDRN